jgi:DNA-binding transcriptional regulator LsrR (DeoR family)
MSVLDDSALLFRVAKYYYLDDCSQSEIAQLENISRPQVSRLLHKARDVGIVRIAVVPPDTPDRSRLIERLQDVLGLDGMCISPSTEKDKENDAGVYSVAATYLSDVLSRCKNVGVGWGKTMYFTSFQLISKPGNKELTFIPIIGNSGTTIPYYQINSITDRFAEKFSAKAYYTQSQFLSPVTRLPQIDQKRLVDLKKRWEGLDAAVIGLGGKIISPKTYFDELPARTNTKRLAEHALGDILGQFFMDDRTIFQFPKEYQVIALDLEALKRIEQVICIARGRHKVEAIVHAARHGYIRTLVTDEFTAKAVLDFVEH